MISLSWDHSAELPRAELPGYNVTSAKSLPLYPYITNRSVANMDVVGVMSMGPCYKANNGAMTLASCLIGSMVTRKGMCLCVIIKLILPARFGRSSLAFLWP